MKKTLILSIGIAGSGKSTYLRKHYPLKTIVCPDNIRKEITGNISDISRDNEVWNEVYNQLEKNLEKYNLAVLDATNTTSRYRKSILEKFPDIRKIALIFNINPEIAKQRVQHDIMDDIERSNVPDEVIDRQYQQFLNGYVNIEKQFDIVKII
jgi:predicted kinase